MSLIYDDLWTGNINILFEIIADVNEAFSCLSAIRKKFYRSCTNTDYTIGESVPINPQRERLLLELAKCTSDDAIWDKIELSDAIKNKYCALFLNCFGYTSIRGLLWDDKKDLVFRWLSTHHMGDLADDIFGTVDWNSRKNMHCENDALRQQLNQRHSECKSPYYKEVYLTRAGNYSYIPPVKKGIVDYTGSRYVYRALVEILFSKEDKEEFFNEKPKGRPPKKKESLTPSAQKYRRIVSGLGVKPFFYSYEADCFRLRIPRTILNQESELEKLDKWLLQFADLFLEDKSKTYKLKSQLTYREYIIAKQDLWALLPTPNGNPNHQEDCLEDLNHKAKEFHDHQEDCLEVLDHKAKEFYDHHKFSDGSQNNEYETDVLLDLVQGYCHDNADMLTCWANIRNRNKGELFSKLLAGSLSSALNNTLRMVDFILKKESLNEDAIDQTIIESKIQKAIIDGFHSV